MITKKKPEKAHILVKKEGHLDGRVLAEEARVVLDELVGLGLVEEVDELQELLQRELMKSSLVPG